MPSATERWGSLVEDLAISRIFGCCPCSRRQKGGVAKDARQASGMVEGKQPDRLGGQNEDQVVANAEVACLQSSQNGKERGRRTRIRRVDTMTDAATFMRCSRIVEDWDRA